jgi:hypothetical protein
MRLELAVAALAACAAGQRVSETDSCPPGSDEIRFGGDRYCAVRCAGALEDDVSFQGLELFGRYDDGPVFHAFQSQRAGDPPDWLCRSLPHGCECATPACTYNYGVLAREASTHRRTLNGRILHGQVPPRCQASDPDCGPEAFSQRCIGELGYHPGAARFPVFEIAPGPHNDCDFDGECAASGWGRPCRSTRKADTGDLGDAYVGGVRRSLHERALCGCIQHTCALFEI